MNTQQTPTTEERPAYTAGGTLLPPAAEFRPEHPAVLRFWQKAGGRGQSPRACWMWTGTREEKGYGLLFVSFRRDGVACRVKLSAHRFAYMLHHGRWASPDRMLLHSCDNPSCINPAHLAEGTARDNNRDTAEKGRHQNGATARERHKLENGVDSWRSGPTEKMLCGSSRLSAFDVQEIRATAQETRKTTIRILADRYNVSPNVIRNVLTKRSFAWVTSQHVAGAGGNS